MDWRLYRDHYRDPFPHSLLSPREKNVVSGSPQKVSSLGLLFFCFTGDFAGPGTTTHARNSWRCWTPRALPGSTISCDLPVTGIFLKILV